MPNPETRESRQENVLEREIPLSIEEISMARSDEVLRKGKRREYNFGDISFSILREGMSSEEFDKNKNQLLSIDKKKQEGEIFAYEGLLVNALTEQGRIAEMFGVKREDLWTGVVADYKIKSRAMMSCFGQKVYMLSLDQHIDLLKKEGATDEQIITEISGHMFHESIHEHDFSIYAELLGKKAPLGELSPITAQLAYYLAKGYKGPKGYDTYRCSLGVGEIKAGKNLELNHEIATAVSAELLLEQLKTAYPDIAAGIETKTSLDACEQIVARIPTERRDALIPALKQAILQSTDEEKFKEVVAGFKKKNN